MANPDTPSKAAVTDGQPHQLTLPVVPNVAVALTKLIAILIKEYGEAQLTATTTYEMYCRRLGVNTKVVACKAYDVFQHGVDNVADSAGADALLIYDPADANRPDAVRAASKVRRHTSEGGHSPRCRSDRYATSQRGATSRSPHGRAQSGEGGCASGDRPNNGSANPGAACGHQTNTVDRRASGH